MDARTSVHLRSATASPSTGTSRSSIDKSLPPPPLPSSSAHRQTPHKHAKSPSTVTVLVGPKQRPFTINRHLLCAASPFFSQRLEDDSSNPKPISLWLPGESSTMFALFKEWVHSPDTFRQFLDDSTSTSQHDSRHWAMIRLHLFASHLRLHRLQDLTMDAIQDLYLRRDWDVSPRLIEYLYTQCESLPAVRVRRWSVAMVAFSLNVEQVRFQPHDAENSDTGRFRALFASLPDFASDYATHVRKMKVAGLHIRFKNPQLRIPANKLRNEERMFGFRECSFHSHRAAVGERRCPYNGRSEHTF